MTLNPTVLGTSSVLWPEVAGTAFPTISPSVSHLVVLQEPCTERKVRFLRAGNLFCSKPRCASPFPVASLSIDKATLGVYCGS